MHYITEKQLITASWQHPDFMNFIQSKTYMRAKYW
jgi:hypothetical protein